MLNHGFSPQLHGVGATVILILHRGLEETLEGTGCGIGSRHSDLRAMLTRQSAAHQAERSSPHSCESTWLGAQVAGALRLWGGEAVAVLPPLPLQTYRRLNLRTALLPSANEDKSVTTDQLQCNRFSTPGSAYIA